MPYQGLLLAAFLGVGFAVAIGLFIANSAQWEEAQIHGGRTRRRRGGCNDYNRRESRSYEQDMCAICHDSMSGRTELRILGCKHKFHNNCIEKWFRAPGVCRCCPLCREPSVM